MTSEKQASAPTLRRAVGLPGAVMMGLGAIIGTGVFVSIGVAAGVAGPAVVLAIAMAALVATCNALNSGQLAASHAVSGGTYEYGYRYLTPGLGFTAGWMFLCAKSASAATAALGFAGYLSAVWTESQAIDPRLIAGAAVIVLTLLVATGIHWSNRANMAIVSVTLTALVLFCVAGIPTALARGGEHWTPFFAGVEHEHHWLPGLLEATALMFVAYTGYGRIATLGEEVREPRTTIPRAIVITLLVSALLYLAVGVIGIATVGAETMSQATLQQAAPLETVAAEFNVPGITTLVAVGAVTAMLGVLLNLILGLSRVLLAMGRRGDMPGAVARLSTTRATPSVAVLVVGLLIAGLVTIGNIKTTWSFSAFTVLIYYSITNLAALRLPTEARLYSKAYGYAGLTACLFLAFWVEPAIWSTGLGMILVGFLWHQAARRLRVRSL